MRSFEKTVLLTGGTGFMGSFLAAELIKAGTYVVFLARDGRDKSAADRVSEVLRWHGQSDESCYRVLSGDLTQPQFGLSAASYEQLAQECTEIWHVASETTFSEKRRELLERVNIQGTRRILEFAVDSHAEMINYVSSCYSVGKVVGDCDEQLIPQTEFNNPYEETKHKAETLLTETCLHLGLPYLIYRPSIIAGHSVTGRTLIFNGLYYPLRMLDYFGQKILSDWADGGENARQLGARVTDNGRVELPVRLPTERNGRSGINVVPIDYVTDACLRIRALGEPGNVYHLVGDAPMDTAELSIAVRNVLKLDAVEFSSADSADDEPRNLVEKQFRSRIQIYLPYMGDLRDFSSKRTSEVMGGVRPPQADLAYLERCLTYALDNKWSTPFK